ncbi:MAG TPA: HlyD family efflux transporter periplasmic adaptor subunit [Opitutaceae bacterium]|jgi:HlyD family secretion protein|nr:HlyD family efflux transporter periplasmic adaptor subunit [Opitutaceae bacterium]
MDIARPDQSKAKRRKRLIIGGSVALGLVAITILLGRLKPAVPSVDRSLVWIDTVKRGPMTREVHGLGTLVPEDISWIPARTTAHVDRIVLKPGAMVQPDSVILILSDPTVVQAAVDADSQLKGAEADLENTRVQLQSSVLQAESDAATAKANYAQARLRAAVEEQLFKDGLDSEMNLQLSKVTADQDQTLNDIQQKRYAFAQNSIVPQLAVKQASVDQLRAQVRLRHADADALNVRAGMKGILQLVSVDVGAQVQIGTNLARVADPTRLMAQVQIAETQAKDMQIGQPAQIDTHNGIVAGKVARIDPSVTNGTVTVDVTLDGALPQGARPDLSVDGTIELEHLDNVVYVGRPAFGDEHATVGIFRLASDGVYAARTQVVLGRSSVNTIEIVKGLVPGDRVILSDMSQWDANDRIKLN